MQQDAAWNVIRTAFKCGSELQALLKYLKQSSDPADYEKYAKAIAAALDSVNVELMDRALADRPELAKRIESDLAKHGRIT